MQHKNKICSADTLFSLLALHYILSSQSILQHLKGNLSMWKLNEYQNVPPDFLCSESVGFILCIFSHKLHTLCLPEKAIQIQS